jgi:hypothetical protein
VKRNLTQLVFDMAILGEKKFNSVSEIKDYKARMFKSRVGRGERERFFVMFSASIEIIIYLENLLYIKSEVHGMRHFGPTVAPQPTVYNKCEMVAPICP